jgi:hypothetical protein
MIKLTKNVLGAGAAAAALVTMSVPAQARDDYNNHNDRGGISAGEVIAGAVVLGGIAAVLSSSSNNDRYNDQGYNGDDQYNRGDDRYNNHGYYDNDRSQAAVNQCIRAVERNSSRYNRAKVTDIREINRTRYGFQVTGKVSVQDGYGYRDRYDDNQRYDQRDEQRYDRGHNSRRFTCYIERGRVVDIDYNGRNNWR